MVSKAKDRKRALTMQELRNMMPRSLMPMANGSFQKTRISSILKYTI